MADETSQPTGPNPTEQDNPRSWRPLEALDRRVLGVLIEKAKTTPEAYPLSLNALRTGCNQKSNRFPTMDVEPEDVEASLQRLREVGAVTEVQGGGRVPRFRHHAYDWLGVDKTEIAVMAELLLRGTQTEGELRGRAARMEPIADVAALRPVIDSLKSKGLVVSLTPAGRGHVVTHALYLPREMEKVKREAGGQVPSAESAPAPTPTPTPAASSAPHSVEEEPPRPARSGDADSDSVEQLRQEVASLRAEVTTMRKDLDDLWANFR